MASGNRPDRYDLFDIPDTVHKIRCTPDPVINNACTFNIMNEDHTIGNLIRMQMLRNPDVVFAGYKMPHPLEKELIIKVRATDNTDPISVFKTSIADLRSEIAYMKAQIKIGKDLVQA
jgi:DNA-directed RNA polymerase II subunit RPB11